LRHQPIQLTQFCPLCSAENKQARYLIAPIRMDQTLVSTAPNPITGGEKDIRKVENNDRVFCLPEIHAQAFEKLQSCDTDLRVYLKCGESAPFGRDTYDLNDIECVACVKRGTRKQLQKLVDTVPTTVDLNQFPTMNARCPWLMPGFVGYLREPLYTFISTEYNDERIPEIWFKIPFTANVDNVIDWLQAAQCTMESPKEEC
jgi:hypothetical protein